MTTVESVISLMTVISEFTIVTLSTLQRRTKPAPQSGPSLGISPSEIAESMDSNGHALSNIISKADGW